MGEDDDDDDNDPSPKGMRRSFRVKHKEVDKDDTRAYVTQRWLNIDVFEEKAEGFATYDPESWWETLAPKMTPFIFYPWALITGMITVLTVIVEMDKEHLMADFAFSMDAHMVMGAPRQGHDLPRVLPSRPYSRAVG